MVECEENNMFEDEGVEEFIEEGALPVCPKCFRPCDPLQNYCNSCGSDEVINPLASYIPFVRIRYNYNGLLNMWRYIWCDEQGKMWRKLVYLLLLIIIVAGVFGGAKAF